MSAQLKGVDQKFTQIYENHNTKITKGLLHVGFVDNEAQTQETGFFEKRALYLIYKNNRMVVCQIPLEAQNSLKIDLGLFLDYCYAYQDAKISYDPSYDAILSVDLFMSHVLFFELFEKDNIAGARIEYISRENDPKKRGKRIEVIPFFKNFKIPKIRENEIWVTNRDQNIILKQLESLVVVRGAHNGNSNPPEPPYFSTIEIFNSQSPTSNITENIDVTVNLALGNGKNKTQTFQFIKIPLYGSKTNFGMKKEKNSRTVFKMSRWNFTTIFFSRPLRCEGLVIKDLNYTHSEKFVIAVQPFKPVYASHFDALPITAPLESSLGNSKNNDLGSLDDQEGRLEPSQRGLGRMKQTNINDDPVRRKFLVNNFSVSGINLATKSLQVITSLASLNLKTLISHHEPDLVFLDTNISKKSKPLGQQKFVFLKGNHQIDQAATDLIAVREMSSSPNFSTISQNSKRFEYGNFLDYSVLNGPIGSTTKINLRLSSKLCYIYIKPKTTQNVSKIDRTKKDKNRKLISLNTAQSIDNITISVKDFANKSYSLSIQVEVNGVQLTQNLTKTKKLIITNLTSFTSFDFYSHFKATGSWIDLNHSLSPNSSMEITSADSIIHSFDELHLVNFVKRPKYLQHSNYTLFKATFIPKNESFYRNDVIVYNQTKLMGMIQHSRIDDQQKNCYTNLLDIGMYKGMTLALKCTTNNPFLFFSKMDTPYLHRSSGYENYNPTRIIDLKLLNLLPYNPVLENGSGQNLCVLFLDSTFKLSLLCYHQKELDEPLESGVYLKINENVNSFDYLSSYKLTDHYGYIFFTAGGDRIDCVGFYASGIGLGQARNMKVNKTELVERVSGFDYVSYVKAHHNQTEGTFELVVDGDDQMLYILTGNLTFYVLDREDESLFRLDVGVDKEVHGYVKPINMDSMECGTTKDFLVCASPVTYTDVFDPGENQYQTILMVWAKKDGAYNGTGYTYRIETIGKIEPKGAFAIWDYNNNTIVSVSQFHKPQIIKLSRSVYIGYKTESKRTENGVNRRKRDDFDLALRANRWAKQDDLIKIKGRDYVSIKINLNIGLIIWIAILILILLCCLAGCLYCHHLYKKLMGIDKKPRVRDNSYIESIISETAEDQKLRIENEIAEKKYYDNNF